MWRNKLIYLVIIIYMGVLAILYSHVQMLYAFILMTMTPVLLFLIILVAKFSVEVEIRSLYPVVSVNQSVKCCLYIKNKAIFPVSSLKVVVKYYNGYQQHKEKQVLTLGVMGKSTQEIQFELKSEHVGILSIEIGEVRAYDLLRIFSRKVKTGNSIDICIMPLIYDMQDTMELGQNILYESNVYSKVKSGDDPSEVFDIREYKEGDRIQRIHWKLSSKKDTIFVKDYSLPINCGIHIFIDLFLPTGNKHVYQYMDALHTTVLSISYQLLLEEQRHTFCWYDKHSKEVMLREVSMIDDLYEVMNELLKSPHYDNSFNLLEYVKNNSEVHNLSHIYYQAMSYDPEIVLIMHKELLSSRLFYTYVTEQVLSEESFNPETSTENLLVQSIQINNVQKQLQALQL